MFRARVDKKSAQECGGGVVLVRRYSRYSRYIRIYYKFAGVQFSYVKRKGGEIQMTERICVIIALLALVTAIITDIKESLRI